MEGLLNMCRSKLYLSYSLEYTEISHTAKIDLCWLIVGEIVRITNFGIANNF